MNHAFSEKSLQEPICTPIKRRIAIRFFLGVVFQKFKSRLKRCAILFHPRRDCRQAHRLFPRGIIVFAIGSPTERTVCILVSHRKFWRDHEKGPGQPRLFVLSMDMIPQLFDTCHRRRDQQELGTPVHHRTIRSCCTSPRAPKFTNSPHRNPAAFRSLWT